MYTKIGDKKKTKIVGKLLSLKFEGHRFSKFQGRKLANQVGQICLPSGLVQALQGQLGLILNGPAL